MKDEYVLITYSTSPLLNNKTEQIITTKNEYLNTMDANQGYMRALIWRISSVTPISEKEVMLLMSLNIPVSTTARDVIADYEERMGS